MTEEGCNCTCCCDSGTNEYDLKIAILQAAMDLVLKQGVEGEDAVAIERRYATSTISALKRAFKIE
jgi:hypothetical protein